MAQRRMFTPDIVQSDAFLEMAPSTQALYFQLGMRADDDGFVNPKTVMRMMGSSEDELKVLAMKRFILPFDNGVIVIKHWRMNNLVRKDWYRETQYLEQKELLYLKKNGAYSLDETAGEPLVNDPLTNRPRSIGKDSIGKDRLLNTSAPADGFDLFWKDYPRKIGKPLARTAYARAVKKAPHDEIMKGLGLWMLSDDWVKDDGKFIPHPTTWLNQERWNDEPRKAKVRTIDRFINPKK